MFKIRSLTTYEANVLEEAKKIKAERRSAFAAVLFDWLAVLAITGLIVAIVAGGLDFFGIVGNRLWEWALNAFVVAAVTMIAVAHIARIDDLSEGENLVLAE